MSYMVARRRNEIGIRMALGADRREVVRMVMREAGRLLGAGVLVGAGGLLVAARAASTLLFGLSRGDPADVADRRGGARCRRRAGELSAGAARVAARADRSAARRVIAALKGPRYGRRAVLSGPPGSQ